MYEGVLLAALVVLVILAIRPAVKYDNPLVIHQPGVYHATLSPQLDRAQKLIEQIAIRFSSVGDIATQYFKMHDAGGHYWLAVGFRASVLYFQAILPAANDDDGNALRKFSDEVMMQIPLARSQDVRGSEYLCSAVEVAASQLQIACLKLQ